MEGRAPYRLGSVNTEPPLTTEDLVARAHAHPQGIPYGTGEQLLQRLPERLRPLADLVLGGRVHAGAVVPRRRSPPD